MINYQKEIAEIINKHIENSPFKNLIKVTENHIHHNEEDKYINWEISITGQPFKYQIGFNDKLADLLTKKLTKSRLYDFGTFYHFKNYDRAVQIIQDKEIQLTALNSHITNDSAEYSEFIRRYSHDPVFDNDFIKTARENVFIFCFTKHFRNERFWNEYAKNNSGLCIGFRFEEINENTAELFSLVDVIYDDGYNFDFINDIQRELLHRFDKYLLIGGLNRFAKYYKRKRYSWESETRLIFDFNENNKLQKLLNGDSILGGGKMPELDLTNYLQINQESNRRFVKIKFNNTFFKLKVTELIMGSNVTSTQKDELSELVDDDVHLWQVK